MGRVQSKGLEFFDLAVTFDDKIECLILIHGNDGLAFMIRFWQMAYKSDKGEVDSSCILHRSILKKQLSVDDKKLDCMICDAIKLGLIDIAVFKKRKMLTSNGIKRRIARISQLREKARERFSRNVKNTSTKNERSIKEEKRRTGSKVHRSDQILRSDQISLRRERERGRDTGTVEAIAANEDSQSPSPSFSPPLKENLFSENDIQRLCLKLGNEQASYWIDEVKLAYERNPEEFLSKIKSPFAAAVTWFRHSVSDGKTWDAVTKTYKKPNGTKQAQSSSELASGALAILEKQEQRRRNRVQENARHSTSTANIGVSIT